MDNQTINDALAFCDGGCWREPAPCQRCIAKLEAQKMKEETTPIQTTSDITTRIRNRLHDAPLDTERMLDDALAEIERLRILIDIFPPRRTEVGKKFPTRERMIGFIRQAEDLAQSQGVKFTLDWFPGVSDEEWEALKTEETWNKLRGGNADE
jgi:hypothetical protein